MALPIVLGAAALRAGLSLLKSQGPRAVVKKYGDDGLKQIEKARKSELAKIDAKAGRGDPSTMTPALRQKGAETIKTKARNKRIDAERLEDALDVINEIKDEVPLKFSKGGLLSTDSSRIGYAEGELAGDKVEFYDRFKDTDDYSREKDKYLELRFLSDTLSEKELDTVYQNVMKGRTKNTQEMLGPIVGKILGGGMNLSEQGLSFLSGFGADRIPIIPNGLITAFNKEADKIINKRKGKQDGGLLNPEKADLDNDGKLSSYEEARGKAIEENMRESKQEGGMMMDDQMADMMEEEDKMPMDNQMEEMIADSQVSDEKMEENYVDFLIDEALSEEEETMLMEELQANPQLSMLFDKVMEVAMEFSGSGPVEGPGTEVSDSIPARLSDGEFVFTAKSVDVLGADNLMSLMKQAEAQADGRQMAQEGGLMEEEDTAMPVQQEPVRQDIRVTKETVDSQAAMQDEEDLVGDEIKKSMLSGRPHVRS